MNRQLTSYEQVSLLIDQGISQNFVMIANIEKSLPEAILRKALILIQKKHPHLRIRITEDESPRFISDDIPEIPLIIKERKDDNSWIEVAEREMQTQLPFSKGPFVRVVQLTSQDKCDLVIAFCHIVADATSGVYFVKHLLEIVEKLSQGLEEPGPILPELPSNLDLLKKDLKFKPDFMDIKGWLMRALHKPAELEGDANVSPEKRVTRVLQRILSSSETQKLVARCKEEGTSVHSILCASFLQTIIEQIRKTQPIPKKGALMIGCTTPVNMRHHFEIPVGESLGDYISHALHFQLIDENSSIWEAAKKVKKSIERELKYGRDIKATEGVGDLLKAHPTPIEMVRGLMDEFPPVAVTNMGRLDIQEKFGDIELKGLHYVVSINPACKNGFAISVTTFRDSLTLNFLYSEPYISNERANAITESTMNRLKTATV